MIKPKTEIVKILVLFASFLLYSKYTSAQERFYKLTPGWTSFKTIEWKGNYLNWGMDVTFSSNNYYKLFVVAATLNSEGDIIDSQRFYLDSIVKDTFISTILTDHNAIVEGKNGLAISISTYHDSYDKNFLFLFDSSLRNPVLKNVNIDTFTTRYISFYQTDEKEWIATGHYQLVQAGLLTSFVTKLDSNFRPLWRKDYSPCSSDCHYRPVRIIPTHDKKASLVVFRREWAFRGSPEAFDHYIKKIDTSGKELWTLDININDSISGMEMRISAGPKNTYFAVWCDMLYRPSKAPYPTSKYLAEPNQKSTIWIAEFSNLGILLWKKKLDRKYLMKDGMNRDSAYFFIGDMQLTDDGNLLLAGDVWNVYRVPYLLKLDMKGNILWFRRILPEQRLDNYATLDSVDGGSGHKVYSFKQLQKGGFILTGEYNTSVPPWYQSESSMQRGFVIKTDEFGCLEKDCQLVGIREQVESEPFYKIYPNPVSLYLNACLKKNYIGKNPEILIYNVTGRLVFSRIFNELVETFDISSLPSGIYFTCIQVDGIKTKGEKLVVVR